MELTLFPCGSSEVRVSYDTLKSNFKMHARHQELSLYLRAGSLKSRANYFAVSSLAAVAAAAAGGPSEIFFHALERAPKVLLYW